jgi:hypothetical protein
VASEDSASDGWLPVVHRLNNASDLEETVDAEMTTLLHKLEHLDELVEVLALGRAKPVRLKERNDDLVEINKPPDDVAIHRLPVIVPPSIDVYPATAEVVSENFERANARRSLNYDELWLHLPADG